MASRLLVFPTCHPANLLRIAEDKSPDRLQSLSCLQWMITTHVETGTINSRASMEVQTLLTRHFSVEILKLDDRHVFVEAGQIEEVRPANLLLLQVTWLPVINPLNEEKHKIIESISIYTQHPCTFPKEAALASKNGRGRAVSLSWQLSCTHLVEDWSLLPGLRRTASNACCKVCLLGNSITPKLNKISSTCLSKMNPFHPQQNWTPGRQFQKAAWTIAFCL